MRLCIAALLGSLACIPTRQEEAVVEEDPPLSTTARTTTREDDHRYHSAIVDECQGFDPPLKNERYLTNFQVSATADHPTDSYRNISVDMELTQYLYENPLLHFYVTDPEMYSYQCENRDSCTYKLCDPGTPQEVNLTKAWNGKCPLVPGKYHYKFVYSLTDALSRQKTRTSLLTVQAQLHQGYECLACVMIRMQFRQD